jgi:predicted anti-sigma-YlaC factor YlaD
VLLRPRDAEGVRLILSLLRPVGLLLLVGLLSACSPRMMLVRGLADELAGQGQAAEDDVLLARDASPFYLKLSESLLRRTPDHLALAESVAGGFTQYAYAFVASEAERLETRDSRAAQKAYTRAARLYQRAQGHALRALELRNPALVAALPLRELPPGVQLRPEEVGTAYWAAAAWGARIALSKDQPEVVADLPQVVRLATLAWQAQPEQGDGALASLMGTLEMARPGGNATQAEAYFARALALGAGRNAGVPVALAESIAQPQGDRVRFEALLKQAVAMAEAHRNLGNEVMRERAQWLLDTVGDRF